MEAGCGDILFKQKGKSDLQAHGAQEGRRNTKKEQKEQAFESGVMRCVVYPDILRLCCSSGNEPDECSH